nr:hypothetical protein [Tanacetum cinerariifolium]
MEKCKRKDSTQEKDKGIQNIPEDDVSSEVRKSDLKMHDKENSTDSTCSGHFKKSDIPYSGGSILLVLDELTLMKDMSLMMMMGENQRALCLEIAMLKLYLTPSVGNKEMHSEDPFNIYDLLKMEKCKRKDSTQEKDKGIQNIPEDDVSSEVRKSDLKMHDKENSTDSTCSGHFKKSDIPYSGGSILLVLDELVKVGQTMGYNMEGCMKNIEEII